MAAIGMMIKMTVTIINSMTLLLTYIRDHAVAMSMLVL